MHQGDYSVKQICKILALGLFFFSTYLCADYGDDDALYKEEEGAVDQKPGPFNLLVSGDYICKARHDHDDDDFKGNIRYNHEKAEFDAIVYYNADCEEAINLSLGYEFTYLNWNKNPFFRRKDYDTLTVAGTYVTHRLDCWQWIVQLAMNIDADKWSLSDYNTYDMLLWGRYTWNSCIGLHFGLYGETGIRLDRVWPVLGFDWTINEKWLINAIFPLNVSLQYQWNDGFALVMTCRFFNERHKAGDQGGYEKAVWRYQNTGADFAIVNNWCSWLKTGIHAGYTFGGKLKIANQRGHENHRFHFQPSAYFGGEISANF
jgi:hypothetical protein